MLYLGGVDSFENGRVIVRRAFDLGITHFDLANNYGPPYGSAEETFGWLLRKDLAPYRDELVISSKAGWDLWPGPYGNWGSRKYLRHLFVRCRTDPPRGENPQRPGYGVSDPSACLQHAGSMD